MCGFLYIQQAENFKASDKVIFDKGLDLLEYRGPDNKSSMLLQNQYFGHVRLAIQDISNGSNQPVDDDYSTLLYNGEIYNFLNLVKHSLSIIAVFKASVIIRSIAFYAIYLILISNNLSVITCIPLALIVIFGILIVKISGRENIDEFNSCLNNIDSVDTIK